MTAVCDIYDFLNKTAPFNTQCIWDNAGLLVGDFSEKVGKICVCLDITPEAVEFAEKNGCSLIVSHHPVIFDPLKSVAKESEVWLLCKYGISAICAHTNLDSAKGGVNDTLAEILELCDVTAFDEDENAAAPMARIGMLKNPMLCGDFAKFVSKKLGCGGLKYTECQRSIKKVAVCGGAGGDFISAAKRLGADALVTADTKHHQLLEAKKTDFCLVDAGHYNTENPVIYTLEKKLSASFPKTEIFVYPAEDPANYINGGQN